jgi:hypothetical protein
MQAGRQWRMCPVVYPWPYLHVPPEAAKTVAPVNGEPVLGDVPVGFPTLRLPSDGVEGRTVAGRRIPGRPRNGTPVGYPPQIRQRQAT